MRYFKVGYIVFGLTQLCSATMDRNYVLDFTGLEFSVAACARGMQKTSHKSIPETFITHSQ